MADLYINGVLQTELPAPDKSSAIRAERDRRITESFWLDQRLADELELGIDLTVTKAQILAYRQALRDITEQAGFPNSIEWPEL